MSKPVNAILWFFGSYVWLASVCVWSHSDNTTMMVINGFISGWYFMTGCITLYGKEDK